MIFCGSPAIDAPCRPCRLLMRSVSHLVPRSFARSLATCGLGVLAFALPLSRPASAQELEGCETSKQWTIHRLGKDHLKLVGQVEVTCREQTFFADEIELFSDTNRLIATGNVVFTSGTSRIAADRLEFNTKTRTGTFFNASGSAALKGDGTGPAVQPVERSIFGTQEPDVYFYGEKIEKIGREKYRITRGGFTTCVQPTPRWQLTSGSVILNLEHYAVLTNSLFKVKGVPLLYLPVFYYPINKEDRATGFLIPGYGTSTIRGQTLSNAFFWAIDRSQDATLLHDWYSATGQGFGGEYRYMAAPGSEGSLRVYNLREHEAEYTQNGVTTVTPARRSYEIRGGLSQRLGRNLRARGRADYFSDITVQQTYNMNVYEASRRQRVFAGSLTGNWGPYNVIGSFDRSQYFYDDTSSTVRGGTPRVSANRAERPLFGTPFYFSVGGEYVTFLARRETAAEIVDNGLSRMDVLPRFRIPFTRWQFLTVNASVGWRFTYWTESKTSTGAQVDDAISRNYFDLQANITGPVFNRIWNRPSSQYASKLKHSVQPFLNLQRVSAIDNFDQIVQLDGTDVIVGSVTRVSYGVQNRLYRKPGDGGRSSEILNVSLGQTYYTDANAALYDRYYQTAYNAPSRFSPLSILVRGWPTERILGQYRAEYDTKFEAFRTMSADGTVAIADWLHTTGGWSQRRYIPGLPGFDDPTRLDHYLNAATQVRLKQNRYGAVYNFNYDLVLNNFLQQRLMGYYNAQCCGFAVEYQTYNLAGLGVRSPVSRDKRFNVSFTLAGIGTFSNFLGALGGTPGRY
jgi:LPS-assembly protein